MLCSKKKKKKCKEDKCAMCGERIHGIHAVRYEEVYHPGCRPCDLCDSPMIRPRNLRVSMGENVQMKPNCRVPWDCWCLNLIVPEMRTRLVTDEILFMLTNGKIKEPEFPEFLEYSIPFIDHHKVFETMNHYKILTKSYSVRDMAKVYELRGMLMERWEDTTEKGGGWSGYNKKGELIKEAFQ